MKAKKFLSLLLSVGMTLSCINVGVFAADAEENTVTETSTESVSYPQAEVSKQPAMTLTEAEHNYIIWPSGDDTIDRPLEIVMNFKAKDTLDEAIAGGYNKWLTDFYLTVTGLESEFIMADNSYLAGKYGDIGWVVIPTDGFKIEDGITYPIVKAYDATLNYEDICESVKDFTAAIHIAPEIVEANPNIKVQLELKMTNPADANDVLVIGEPAVYTADALLGKPQAEVSVLDAMTLTAEEHRVWQGGSNLAAGTSDLPLEIVMNFKAKDTLEEALAGGYSKWLTDFYLTVTGLENGSITADNSYLAGNYGTFGWIVIPTDDFVIEDGVTYPIVSNYDATLNYKDICKSVQNFTAAIHIAPEIIEANPDITVKLELKMTNPNDENDVLVIGEPAIYTAQDLLPLSFTDDSVIVKNPKNTGTLVLASYDAQGVLAGVKLITVEKNDKINIAGTGIATSKTLMATLWDSTKTMVPLCKSITK